MIDVIWDVDPKTIDHDNLREVLNTKHITVFATTENPVFKILNDRDDGIKYAHVGVAKIWVKKWKVWLTIWHKFPSDGATGAFDILSWAQWFHDLMCMRCTWDNGRPITNIQASLVLRWILAAEAKRMLRDDKPLKATKRLARSRTWFWATFFLGGWKLKKKNGWF